MKQKNDVKREISSASLVMLKMIVWILGVIAVYWLILKITGHSPTSEAVMMVVLTILVGLVSLSIGVIIRMNREIGEIKRDIKYMKEEMSSIRRMLYALIRDFREFGNQAH